MTPDEIASELAAFEARAKVFDTKQTEMFARHRGLFDEQTEVGQGITQVQARWKAFKTKRLTKRRRLLLVAWVIGTVFVSQTLGKETVDHAAHLDAFYQWISASRTRALVTLLALFSLGYAANMFRSRKRAHYGAFEVGAAMSVALLSLEHPRDGAGQTASLVGVLYFLVRGLDNLHTGVKQELEALDKRAQADSKESLAIVEEFEKLEQKHQGVSARIKTAREESDALEEETRSLRADYEKLKTKVRRLSGLAD